MPDPVPTSGWQGRRILVPEGHRQVNELRQARLLDQRGRLHLGQPSRSYKDGGTTATLLLRPGLSDGVSSLHVRVTSRGRKVEGQVAL